MNEKINLTPLMLGGADFQNEEPTSVNCQYCHDSKLEMVYAGDGNVLELPCSMCCVDDTVAFRWKALSNPNGGFY